MPMSLPRLALVLVAATICLAATASAQREYIRDEIRVNMRAGPGLQYRIIKVMVSGEPVHRLGEQDDWVRVSTAEDEEGWVPGGYLSSAVPPSVTLPQVQSKLARADARVGELEQKLKAQAEAIQELESLRERSSELETENSELRWSTGWKSMATGAVVLLVGILIGVAMPRGSARSARRIKL